MPTSKPLLSFALALGAALAVSGCVPAPGTEAGPGGGSSGSGGARGGSGPAGSGGSSPAASGSGGSSSGSGGSAPSGSGGSIPTGSGGSTPAGSGGDSGNASGGNGGGQAQDDGGAAGSGGAVPDAAATGSAGGAPRPSPGCGKPNPPTGARTVMTGGKMAGFIVTLPAGYDPNKPMPLGFAFHGYGLNEKTCAAGSECPGFKDLKAITVFPKSIGAGWEYPLPLLDPNVKFFEDTVALMKNEYCVDEHRIFVAGVSSGGQFVNHLSCRFGDWLWAVSPIAAYVEPAVKVGCKGAPPEIIIHGITDNLEKNAHPVRDLYAMRNGCPTVPPDMAKAEADMMAARAATRAEVACVNYEGCTANRALLRVLADHLQQPDPRLAQGRRHVDPGVSRHAEIATRWNSQRGRGGARAAVRRLGYIQLA
jgi:polyhydroxybutyrate depolymerase